MVIMRTEIVSVWALKISIKKFPPKILSVCSLNKVDVAVFCVNEYRISGCVWSLYSIQARKNVVTFRTVLASFAILKC